MYWMIPFPVLNISFGLTSNSLKHVVKEVFDGVQKVGEIILFPVFKTNFRLVIKSSKHFVKEVFFLLEFRK